MSTIEIEVDDRGRASLKSAGIGPGKYRVTRNVNSFELAPVRSFTDAELLALADPTLRQLHQDFRDGKITTTPADDLP